MIEIETRLKLKFAGVPYLPGYNHFCKPYEIEKTLSVHDPRRKPGVQAWKSLTSTTRTNDELDKVDRVHKMFYQREGGRGIGGPLELHCGQVRGGIPKEDIFAFVGATQEEGTGPQSNMLVTTEPSVRLSHVYIRYMKDQTAKELPNLDKYHAAVARQAPNNLDRTVPTSLISLATIQKALVELGYDRIPDDRVPEFARYQLSHFNFREGMVVWSTADGSLHQGIGKDHFARDLNKAAAAFSPLSQETSQPKRIVTGNWGCGAFYGVSALKALTQWAAASAVQRPLVYFPFDGIMPVRDLVMLCLIAKKAVEGNITVKKLVEVLDNLSEKKAWPNNRAQPDSDGDLVDLRVDELLDEVWNGLFPGEDLPTGEEKIVLLNSKEEKLEIKVPEAILSRKGPDFESRRALAKSFWGEKLHNDNLISQSPYNAMASKKEGQSL